jgi:metal-responsive CopG/Arc/MetJ family transcriptional regulator
MKNRSRMNLTLPAPLAEKIRARAAELGTSQSAVIEDALRSFLTLRQLDDIESRLAETQYELDVLLEAFAEVTEPRFFELMFEAERRLEQDVTRRPDRTN